MNVVYEASVLEAIQDEVVRAESCGRSILRVELSSREMNSLVRELGGETSCTSLSPRKVPFIGFDVVEVFNEK